MVQDKKNFSTGKKVMDETRDQDQKGQSRSAEKSADSARPGSAKDQAGLSKNKIDNTKRGMSSRK